jgi:hypothetical protein
MTRDKLTVVTPDIGFAISWGNLTLHKEVGSDRAG